MFGLGRTGLDSASFTGLPGHFLLRAGTWVDELLSSGRSDSGAKKFDSRRILSTSRGSKRGSDSPLTTDA